MSYGPDIVRSLRGKWYGRHGMCRCPAHKDRTPSLSLTLTQDGQTLVYCHAGCTQADVIAALTSLGLWDKSRKRDRDGDVRPFDGVPKELGKDALDRRELAQKMWGQAIPIGGTLAETYLRKRGILIRLPDQLRFHPRLKQGREPAPAMVARIATETAFCAVQRTFLTPEAGKRENAASGLAAKMTLGPMGQGAVMLFEPGAMLGLAEGIETALSVTQEFQLPCWAVLGIERFSRIRIPRQVRRLMLFADRNSYNARTDHDTIDTVFDAADAYRRTGLQVEVVAPKEHFGDVKDFNDAVRA